MRKRKQSIIKSKAKSMNIKLTKDRLEALHVIVQAALQTFTPVSMSDKLLYELVDKINDRMRDKIRKANYNNQIGWGLKLNSVDAKAFYVWYTAIESRVQIAEHYRYEAIIARDVINKIDKEYG